MSTASETILALEKALEAGPTPGPWSWWTSCSFRRLSSDATGRDGDVLYGAVQKHDNHGDIQATQATMDFIAAANPLAIRTLLDAHASALRDAAKLRAALQACAEYLSGHQTRNNETDTVARDSARAALDDNTKKETT